jgi:hypothetical protein
MRHSIVQGSYRPCLMLSTITEPVGFTRFPKLPSLGTFMNAPLRHQAYARLADISRLRPARNGFDYWEWIAEPSPPVPIANPHLQGTADISFRWSTGVGQIQVRVTSRPLKDWKCPTRKAKGSTPLRY